MLNRRLNSLNRICQIDVTAFASVMVVLVFAMLAAEMIGGVPDRGVGVDLPKVEHPIEMWRANRRDALIVAILRDGSIYFGNDRLNAEDLAAEIRERISHGAESKVYLNTDARVRYGSVVPILDGVRAAGVASIGILVDQRRTRPATQ